MADGGYFLLNTDGGMVNPGNRQQGDPAGEAAIAAVLSRVKNKKERLLDSFAGPIGVATNAQAEYRAVIEGLEFALNQHEVRQVRLFVDSEFVVDQLNGRSKVGSDAVREFHEEAKELLGKFDDYRVSWVPRERNSAADALVQSILYP